MFVFSDSPHKLSVLRFVTKEITIKESLKNQEKVVVHFSSFFLCYADMYLLFI